jgi:hypothetical protein
MLLDPDYTSADDTPGSVPTVSSGVPHKLFLNQGRGCSGKQLWAIQQPFSTWPPFQRRTLPRSLSPPLKRWVNSAIRSFCPRFVSGHAVRNILLTPLSDTMVRTHPLFSKVYSIHSRRAESFIPGIRFIRMAGSLGWQRDRLVANASRDAIGIPNIGGGMKFKSWRWEGYKTSCGATCAIKN